MLVNVRIHIPRVPNFVRIAGTTIGMVGIEELDDEELRTLGKQWTEKLLEHANSRRGHQPLGRYNDRVGG